jgi:hypothetical protein
LIATSPVGGGDKDLGARTFKGANWNSRWVHPVDVPPPSLESAEVKDPILTIIYRIFAALAFLAAALVLIATAIHGGEVLPAIFLFANCVFASVLFLGIAEVILLIAKIEFNTRSAGQGIGGGEKLQREMAASLKQLVEASRAVAALPPIPGEERYYLAMEGKVDGPYRIGDLQALVDKGAISGESFLIEEGGKAWRKTSTLSA